MNKRDIRTKVRTFRNTLTEQARAGESHVVAKRLALLKAIQNAQIVATYAASKGELNPNGFVSLMDKPPSLAFPRVSGMGEMTLHLSNLYELEAGAYDIPEPNIDDPEVKLEDIDVLLLPGLAYDLSGHRVGYGGGYYDRLLAHSEPTKIPILIGISYDETVFDVLPVEKHDQCVDMIVTPLRVLQIEPSLP